MGWFGRLATVLLVVLVAAGPTAAAVCEAACVPPAASVEAAGSNATGGHEHHHGVVAQAPAAHPGAAGHQQQQQPVRDTAAAPTDSHGSQFVVTRDCCHQLAMRGVSLAASRVDIDLLSASHAAVLSPTAMLAMRDRQPARPTHGPPPGEFSTVRLAPVLRI